VELSLELSGGTVQPGRYRSVLRARAGDAGADLPVEVVVVRPAEGVGALSVGELPASLVQGRVIPLPVEVRDTAGLPLADGTVGWRVEPGHGGFVDGEGRFVGYRPGPVTLVASVGPLRDSATLEVIPRNREGSLTVVGEGPETARYTSDLWVRGSAAHLGTWAARPDSAGGVNFGDALVTWDVSDPAAPVRRQTLRVDARTVNDVKLHPDRPLALVTHEGSNDGQNGVTFLDLSDPLAPRPVSRFTEGLEPGVHNGWLHGDYAYLVVDGVGNGLRVVDVSDPERPRGVARWWAGSSFLHDVYVRDGLAFLSHWNAGLVILDVGHGIAGGTPTAPREVSRIQDLGGQTHNAWYWPDAGLVFVGEEDFATPGRLRVVDVSDLRTPRVVGTFAVPGDTPHNLWLDEEARVLYLAWYGAGIRALDVSGELLGDLGRQGREIMGLRYGGEGPCPGEDATCAWAPQLHRGLLHLSDINRGLVILRPRVEPTEAP
jgi:hypothetical protein